MSKNRNHIARTLALFRARQNGWLEGQSLQDLAVRLGVNRSTICRDLHDLENIERLVEQNLDQLAPQIRTF